jgi:hypothetical protein
MGLKGEKPTSTALIEVLELTYITSIGQDACVKRWVRDMMRHDDTLAIQITIQTGKLVYPIN